MLEELSFLLPASGWGKNMWVLTSLSMLSVVITASLNDLGKKGSKTGYEIMYELLSQKVMITDDFESGLDKFMKAKDVFVAPLTIAAGWHPNLQRRLCFCTPQRGKSYCLQALLVYSPQVGPLWNRVPV